MNIVAKEPHSPYTVNVAYTALSLHKLGISPHQLPEGGMLTVNGKRYQIEHNNSFLSMAKDFHDIIWDGIKKTSNQKRYGYQ